MVEVVALVDYGAGNLHSVHNALKAAGAEVTVTADPYVVRAADRIVLFDPPLQGPFGQAVTQLAIRHHLLPRDLAPDAVASLVQALPASAGFTFDLGAAQYRYTRLGVERLPSTTKESADDAA